MVERRMFISQRRVLLVFALALAARYPVLAVDVEGTGRVSTRLDVDSNARREFEQFGTQTDGVVSAIGSGRGRLLFPWGVLAGTYDVAAQKFFTVTSEDVLIQSATVALSIPIGGLLAAGVDARAKDRRGGSRRYTDLAGGGFLLFFPGDGWTIRLGGSGHRFIYPPFFPYSFTAGEATGQVEYRFARRHSVAFLGDFGVRWFNAVADVNPAQPPSQNPEQRVDKVAIAGLSYRYQGPVLASVAYSYGNFDSNSFGQSAHRHRLSASVGVRLPWQSTLLAEGVLELTNYPDRIFISPEILLINDENLNSISIKLARPILSNVDIELDYAFYQASFPGTGMTYNYLRMVGGIGLTWRLW